MKRARIAVAALLAAALIPAAGAAVPTITYEFTGYTLTLGGLGFTSNQTYDNSGSYVNSSILLGAEGGGGLVYVPGDTVANYNSGRVSASFSSAGKASSVVNRIAAPVSSSFSWSVEAKDGWQLESVSSSYSANGYYYQNGGGFTPVTGSVTSSPTGGTAPDPFLNRPAEVTRRVDSQDGDYAEGYWTFSGSSRLTGNRVEQRSGEIRGADGSLQGFSESFSLSSGVTPLTSVSGTAQWLASAAISETAYSWADSFMQHYGGSFMLDAVAIQSVSPVPEPSTYAMMGFGLGLVGLIARRRGTPAAHAAVPTLA